MNREVVNKIWELQEQMMEDEEYRDLLAGREEHNAQFLALLDTLTKEQEAGVLNYLGYLMEIHYKMLEYLMK